MYKAVCGPTSIPHNLAIAYKMAPVKRQRVSCWVYMGKIRKFRSANHYGPQRVKRSLEKRVDCGAPVIDFAAGATLLSMQFTSKSLLVIEDVARSLYGGAIPHLIALRSGRRRQTVRSMVHQLETDTIVSRDWLQPQNL
eukprot:sb/3474363/